MNLREIRKGKGLTQEELADAIGMDQASISRIENRKQPITVEQLRTMAQALEVPIETLVSAA